MSENTKIEWADHTFNPWIGCTKVSPGCDHCYAEAWDRRFAVSGNAMRWGNGKARTRTGAANWRQQLKWNAEAESTGTRARVFCASLADVFDNEVPDEWRQDLFELIGETPNLDWLLLTKRIGNAEDMINRALLDDGPTWPWPHVWLGASIVNQDEADRDIPKLLATPAATHFLSMEPLLGPVNLMMLGAATWTNGALGHRLTHIETDALRGLRIINGLEAEDVPRLDWVIVGGESGPHARPMHPDWVRSLRDQCTAAGVPFLFKQWGEHSLDYDRDRDDPDFRRCADMARRPGRWININGGHGFHGLRVHYAHRVGKKAAGRLLDGRTWDEVPG